MWKLALLRAHIPLPATVCNIHLHLTINNWHLKNHSQRPPLGLIHKLQKNTFDLRCWVQLMMQNASNNPSQTSSYDIYSFPDLLILNKKTAWSEYQKSHPTSYRRHRCCSWFITKLQTPLLGLPVIVQILNTIPITIVPGPPTDTTDNRNLYQTNLIFPFK